MDAVCGGILFYPWLGGVFRCVKKIRTFLDYCLEVSVVADKVAVFSSVCLSSFHCCFQGILEVGSCVSPNIQVHVLSQALSSHWQQFPCCFRCFCIVLSNCVFYKWVVLWHSVAVVQSPLWVISLDNILIVSLKQQKLCTLVFFCQQVK